jgi:hypothetical protein
MDAGTNLAHDIASRTEWWAVDRVDGSHFDSASPAGSNKSVDESSQDCKREPALARNMKGELCEMILVSSDLQARRRGGQHASEGRWMDGFA